MVCSKELAGRMCRRAESHRGQSGVRNEINRSKTRAIIIQSKWIACKIERALTRLIRGLEINRLISKLLHAHGSARRTSNSFHRLSARALPSTRVGYPPRCQFHAQIAFESNSVFESGTRS